MSDERIKAYKAPMFLPGGHLQTIYPSVFRKLDHSFYKRERIGTPDDDFIDLDWSKIRGRKLAILSHGLEGSSYRPYMVGMVRALNQTGWDGLAWNFRSCSGEINRQLKFYHNGATDDLDLVIKHALQTDQYDEIALVGFSMGGNLSLVYLGQKNDGLNSRIKKSVVFSVPGDLKSSSIKLSRLVNSIYMRRFLRSLHIKVKEKMALFPDKIDDREYHQIKNFKQFDDRYTAPIHGFEDAEDYWAKCSSNQFIPHIRIPTLIINAINDPFLTEECFPVKETEQSQCVKLEISKAGGHVGFISLNKEGIYWSEKRAQNFLNSC